MKTLTLILIGILSWQFSLNTSKQVELATTKEAEISQHSKNSSPNIEVSYTLSMHLDEEQIKNYPENVKNHFKSMFAEDRYYTLKIKDMESIYLLENDLNKESTSTKRQNKIRAFRIGHSNYFKDFKTGKVIEQKYMEENDIYLIEEELATYDWKLTDEIAEISGYTCKSATNTSATGNTIKVWYTEDIPSSNGPGHFHGLPGLILKAEATNFNIYATKISFPEQLSVEPFTEGKKISRNEINNIINEIFLVDGKKAEEYEEGDNIILRKTIATININEMLQADDKTVDEDGETTTIRKTIIID